VFQLWEDGAWLDYNRFVYTYDADGNLVMETTQVGPPDWAGANRYVYPYDDEGHRSAKVFERWIDGAWQTQSRIAYAYDEEGRRIEARYQTWSGTEWFNQDRLLYSYTAAGDFDILVREYWVAGAFRATERAYYSYDELDRVTELRAEAISGEGEWMNTERALYAYDENGDRAEQLVQRWWSDLGHWTNDQLYQFTYDQGLETEQTYQRWDEESEAWLPPLSREVYTYDAAGQWVRWQEQRRDSGTEEWTDFRGEHYAYDEAGNRIETIQQDWENGAWVNRLRLLYNYGSPTAEESTSEPSAGASLTPPWPNPASAPSFATTELRVAAAQRVRVALYDVLGRAVARLHDGPVAPGATLALRVPTGHLALGLYVVRAEGEGFVRTQRLVVIR
jgi:hypothetical protein